MKVGGRKHLDLNHWVNGGKRGFLGVLVAWDNQYQPYLPFNLLLDLVKAGYWPKFMDFMYNTKYAEVRKTMYMIF